MNYRHVYHAGNFGDVLKHAVLALVLDHLKRKDAPFRVLDTHAGIGLYDLAAREAEATGEWEGGVGRLWTDRPTGAAGAALAPWYAVLDALNPDGRLARYPGSPEIAARLMRPEDRAVLCELHPKDGATLARRYRSAPRFEIARIDGWRAIAARLPPRERRGLVLIDPPFEVEDEFVRLSTGLAEAHRRFATGVLIAWYPVKGTVDVRGLCRAVAALAIPKTLRVELHARAPNHPGRFDGAGLIVVNPPWTLEGALRALLPVLAARLSSGPGAGHILDWLVPEGAPLDKGRRGS